MSAEHGRRDRARIAVVGGYGAGLTMRVPRAPNAGETVSGGSYDAGPGGKGSNQAIAAARLGAEVALLTAIGDDDFGRSARELWAVEGVDVTHVVDGSAPTMIGFIIVEPSGENRIAIASGALNELAPAAVRAFSHQIAVADIVVVSMEIPEDAVLESLLIGREVGTTTLLNPAPARPLPDEVWGSIDILTPNETEAAILLGLDRGHNLSDDELVRRLQRRTAGSVILTRGERGVLLCTRDGNVEEISAVSVPRVVDTTGAGDSYTAALAVALAEGRPLREAARFAATAAGAAVTIAGVIPSLPTRSMLIPEHRAVQ